MYYKNMGITFYPRYKKIILQISIN